MLSKTLALAGAFTALLLPLLPLRNPAILSTLLLMISLLQLLVFQFEGYANPESPKAHPRMRQVPRTSCTILKISKKSSSLQRRGSNSTYVSKDPLWLQKKKCHWSTPLHVKHFRSLAFITTKVGHIIFRELSWLLTTTHRNRLRQFYHQTSESTVASHNRINLYLVRVFVKPLCSGKSSNRLHRQSCTNIT